MLQESQQIIADALLSGVPQAIRQHGAAESGDAVEGHQVEVADLVFFVVSAFRRHPHINNVFTHISGGSWSRVEQALRTILDPCAGSRDLSPLARNIVELMCAESGVTGRIVKPYYRELLVAALGERVAKRLIAHAACLFADAERGDRAARRLRPGAEEGGCDAEQHA
jgi:hypothetical protein